MITVEVTTVIGRLTLRRTIEESYRFLRPLTAEYFNIREVLLNPDGSFCVPVYKWRDHIFDITLLLSDIAGVDDAAFLTYLACEFVRQMPDDTRRYCSSALDVYAVQLGKSTRAELVVRPAVPIVKETPNE
jgi:hypothetical protein